MNPVLLDAQLELATVQINNLSKKREAIFLKLEALREAVGELIRKEPLLSDIEGYLKEEAFEEARAMALRTWFRLENIQLEINPYKLDGLEIPDTVVKVIEAWEIARYASEDPLKYWSDSKQAFKNLPVTKEEKVKIGRRNELYADTEEKIDLIKFARNMVNLINMANKDEHAGYYPYKMKDGIGYLSPFVKGESRGEGKNQHYHYELIEKKLLVPTFDYEAFDEFS